MNLKNNYFKKLFTGENDTMKIFQNIFWMIFSKGFNIIISFVVGIFTIKYLGAENFGRFSYSYSIIAFFSIFIVFGLKDVVIKELANNEDKIEIIIGNVIIVQLIVAIVCLIFTVLFAFVSESKDVINKQLILILAVSYLLIPLNSFSFIFETKLQGRKVVLGANIALICASFFKILIVIYKLNILVYSLAALSEVLINAFYLTLLFYNKKYKVKFKVDLNIIYPIFKLATPVAISTISIWLYMRLDQILIRHLSTTTEMGIYATSSRFTESLYFIPMVIQSSFLSILVKKRKESITIFYKFLNKMIRIQLLVSIIVSILFYFLIRVLVIFYLGNKFLMVINVSSILIFNLIFLSIAIIRSSFMYIYNLVYLFVPITIISLVINILLNIYLLPRYGAIGCAFAILITQGLAAFVIPFFFAPLRISLKLVYKLIFGFKGF